MESTEIEEYVQHKVEIALARQRNSIVSLFEHELSEIEIELTGPDIRPDFSLRRARRMLAAIRKLKGAGNGS